MLPSSSLAGTASIPNESLISALTFSCTNNTFSRFACFWAIQNGMMLCGFLHGLHFLLTVELVCDWDGAGCWVDRVQQWGEMAPSYLWPHPLAEATWRCTLVTWGGQDPHDLLCTEQGRDGRIWVLELKEVGTSSTDDLNFPRWSVLKVSPKCSSQSGAWNLMLLTATATDLSESAFACPAGSDNISWTFPWLSVTAKEAERLFRL